MSACKECSNHIYRSYGLDECKASPKMKWDTYEGKLVIVDYKSCAEINTGSDACRDFVLKSNFDFSFGFMQKFFNRIRGNQ